jgi:hypothetical protein
MFRSSAVRFIFNLHKKEYFLFILNIHITMLHEILQFIYAEEKPLTRMVAPCMYFRLPILAGLLPRVNYPILDPIPTPTPTLFSPLPTNTCKNCIQTTLTSLNLLLQGKRKVFISLFSLI